MPIERERRFETNEINERPIGRVPVRLNLERIDTRVIYSAKRRPAVPEEVRDREQFEVGKVYERIHLGKGGVIESRVKFQLVSAPFQDEYEKWWMRGKSVEEEQYPPRVDSFHNYSLIDLGIMPRLGEKGLLWNQVNYLLMEHTEAQAEEIKVWNNHDRIFSRESAKSDLRVTIGFFKETEEEGRYITVDQVAKPEDFVVGQTYDVTHEGQEERDYSFVATSEPYDKDDRKVIDVERIFGEKHVPTTIDLGDHGVVPLYTLRIPVE